MIRGHDDAIWRRPRLIPFTVKLPDEKTDKRLPEKLKVEWPGILAWAVRGCLEWQRIGLAEPDEVKRAVSDYRAEMDIIGQFLRDRSIVRSDQQTIKTNSSDLYNAFLRWSGETHITQKAFTDWLREQGYSKKMGGDGRIYWLGIGLSVAPDDDRDR